MENAKKLAKFLGHHEETHVVGWRKHFLPGTKSRKRWDLACALFIIWYAFELPFRMAFYYFKLNITRLLVCWCVDLFFVVDFFMQRQFFPFRDVKTGLVVLDTSEILKNFKENVSWREKSLTIFCCFPFDLLLINQVVDTKFIFILRLSKCLRLLQLTTVIKDLEEDFSEELKMFDNSKRRFVKLNMAMVLACHWIGCVWHFIGSFSKRSDMENWIDSDNGNFFLSHTDMNGYSGYMRSFYFALVGMSTVGYGDIVPQNEMETSVAALIILVGGLILPAVVGGLASLMGNMNSGIAHFHRKMDSLTNHMYEENFSRELREKILSYYNYLWTKLGGTDNKEMELADLPVSLRDSLSKCIKGPILAQVPFLEHSNPEVMKSIRAKLQPQIFLPGDTIINAGDFGEVSEKNVEDKKERKS